MTVIGAMVEPSVRSLRHYRSGFSTLAPKVVEDHLGNPIFTSIGDPEMAQIKVHYQLRDQGRVITIRKTFFLGE